MEFFNAFAVSLQSVWFDSGFSAFTVGNGIMIAVGLLLLYLAFVKEFEPLLLGPIAFGCILANFPRTGFFDEMGLMMAIHYGIAYLLGYRRHDGFRAVAGAAVNASFGCGGAIRGVHLPGGSHALGLYGAGGGGYRHHRRCGRSDGHLSFD